MKSGRNDLCPCGSGIKYKQCCLKKEQMGSQDDLKWRRMRTVIDTLPMKLIEFADNHFGQGALVHAWDAFMPYKDEQFSAETPHLLIFFPWLFFAWLPTSDNTSVKLEARDGRSLGQAYLDKKGRQLDPLIVRYIEQCCDTPFSFYDVVSVRPGKGYILCDIFTDEEIDVTEHSGSYKMQARSIMFAKVIKLEGLALIEASCPMLIPPIEKFAILELRHKIERSRQPITQQLLKDYLDDMLCIYHKITKKLLNPPMPQFMNTDNEPMLSHRLIYEIESPQAAFDALKTLCLISTANDLLTEAKFDAKGQLHTIEFSWEKFGNEMIDFLENTVLGHIKISGRRLVCEVNSENRALKLRTLIAEMLPEAHYKTTVIESLQAMKKRMNEDGEMATFRRRQESVDELNNCSDVQTEITKYMRQFYDVWLYTKIPALGGKSPLQAIETSDGSEMVEVLLNDIEHRGISANPPLDPSIIAELRERLGLQ